MGLRDIGATLPPGFRFYPSDEELVCHYLYKKITNEEALKGTLVEIDLHTCEPWQLPDVAKLNASEWYFFSFRDRKYATGFRTNRATISGYWKATGKDRTVHDPVTHEIVGMRKTLVFYRNRAPNGIKTAWIMHEFRLETPHMPPKEDWVLCRVFCRSKGSPDNINGSNGELSHHFMLDTTTLSPPLSNNMALMQHGYNNSHNLYNYDVPISSSPTSTLCQNNPSTITSNNNNNNTTSMFQLLHHHLDRSSSDISSKVAAADVDTYGFLWGADGVSSNNNDLSGMRFDLEDDGMIFQLLE